MTHRDRKTNGQLKPRAQMAPGKLTPSTKGARPPPAWDPRSKSAAAAAPSAGTLPIHKQPALPAEIDVLQVLSSALKDTLSRDDLATQIQRIKALLYDRKFLEVFEDAALLEAYVVRWVPSRALAFRELIGGSDYLLRALKGKGKARDLDLDAGQAPRTTSIVALGGGACSELLALASILSSDVEQDPKPASEIHLVDIGPYGPIVDIFEQALQKRYAWETRVRFHLFDILESLQLEELLQPNSIITLLFTLTELFLQSRPKTIELLRRLTRSTSKGALFLVADSANEEASSLSVGSSGRAYDLGTVLDGLLCRPEAEGQRASWECVEREESKWFRLREGLQEHYPIKLENTRYWMRLYRRL